MEVGIVGNDHVDLLNVKKRNKNKLYFKKRNMVYHCNPMDFTRKRTIKYGHELEKTDEVIMFKEGRIYPYHRHCNLVTYSAKKLQSDMDIEKSNFRQKHKFGSFLAKLDGTSLWPVIVIAVTLIALALTASAGSVF